MNLRHTLYDLAAQQRLAAEPTTRLEYSAGLHDEPSALMHQLPRGLAVLAAALVGLGIVFWIAANWEGLGRFGRFVLLQGTVLAMAAGAWWRPALRLPLALLAFVASGALLAYFGQTYQTGADPWQLFALWAALLLPLVWAQRSDTVWAPWALVAITAAALWGTAHTGQRWRALPVDAGAHVIGWCGALVVVALLSPPARRFSDAGPWSFRWAVLLTVTMVGSTALLGLFQGRVAPQYGLGLVLMAALAGLWATRQLRDIVALSAVALGLNVLLFAGLARWLFDRGDADPVGRLLLLGAVAAGLLAATVSLILRLARTQGGR